MYQARARSRTTDSLCAAARCQVACVALAEVEGCLGFSCVIVLTWQDDWRISRHEGLLNLGIVVLIATNIR
jgi:hypothetical protein